MSECPNGYWWCEHCKQELCSENVTFGEEHNSCGYEAVWIEPEDPLEAAQKRIAELEAKLAEQVHFAKQNSRLNKDTIGCLEKENAALKEKLENLIDAVEYAHNSSDYRAVFALYSINGGVYQGPQYVTQLEAAKALLQSLKPSTTEGNEQAKEE